MVELRARVKGFLKQVLFQESAEVEKDQLLMVIDKEPFEVQVAIASGKLEEASAALKKAEESKAVEVADAQVKLDEASLGLAQV